MRTRPTTRPNSTTCIARLALSVVAATVIALTFVPSLVSGTKAAAAPPPGLTVPAYWTVASDGGIFSFGGAPFYGSEGGKPLNQPIVGMAATADRGGYWMVASDGGIFSFGDAWFYGSEGGQPLNQPIVGMAATPDGQGYWMVARDGGIFTFGDAWFYGSEGGQPLNQPIVGMTPTPDGRGYWLVAADGGIFTFGDAWFYGSQGGKPLNAPIVGMAATPNGGYLMVASDGGLFGFGIAGSQFYGSEGGTPLNSPVVGIATTPGEAGYWMVARDGGIFSFGNAGFYGSMGGQPLNAPMVGIAQALGNGSSPAPPPPPPPPPAPTGGSGTYGYDVSVFNCGNLPNAGGLSIVQVVGASFGATNGCLKQEANWAGGGLNLYMFLNFGAVSGALPPQCNGNPNYCYGYEAGQDAFNKAKAAGVNANVAWWIDVESTAGSGLPAWSGNTLMNDWVIQGAHDGLAAEGLATVGVYASPGGGWPQIAGNWPINYPYWMATWTNVSGPASCNTIATWQSRTPGLPTGGVPMVQWTNNAITVNNQPTDGDYIC